MPVHKTWDGKEYVTVYFEPLFCQKEEEADKLAEEWLACAQKR